MKRLFVVLAMSFGYTCLFGAGNLQSESVEDLFEKWKQEYEYEQKNWKSASFFDIGPNEETKSYWKLREDYQTMMPFMVRKMKQKHDTDESLKDYLMAIKMLSFVLNIKFEESSYKPDRTKILLTDYGIQYEPVRQYEKKKNVVSQLELWWDEGRKLTPEIFARKYADYQTAKKSGKAEDVKAKYTLLQNMGIIILPDILDKIESGETDLIPMFAYLSDQKDLKTAAACRTWWDANKKRYEVILDYKQKGEVK